jgi:poly [ADP-ribose] polymerase 2/3/4
MDQTTKQNILHAFLACANTPKPPAIGKKTKTKAAPKPAAKALPAPNQGTNPTTIQITKPRAMLTATTPPSPAPHTTPGNPGNPSNPGNPGTPAKAGTTTPNATPTQTKTQSQNRPPDPAALKEVVLIYSDVGANNNKVWKGRLLPNGDVHTEWGRVGKTMQQKTYPRAGASKLLQKESEKLAKGYTHAHIITNATAPKHTSNANLMDVAINQIAKGDTLLKDLVTMLVQANIHQITSQSQITYNSTTGLFQTPLGIVTDWGIQKAYRLLAEIQNALERHQLQNAAATINEYLRVIPQDFGMRLDIHAMFPNGAAIQKQRDLLDALEASFNTTQRAQPEPQATEKNQTTQEQKEEEVFSVNITACSKEETERLRKLYRKTKSTMHRYVTDMDVKRAYEIEIPTQRRVFETEGRPLGNVQTLWHGTKLANVLNILRVGLKVSPPRTAAIAGALYGPGLYFSDMSSKSLNYATNYWHGGGRGTDQTFFMFLANVAMGKPFIPKGARSSRPPQGYHSYLAKAGQSGVIHNEMVIPSENQADLIRLVEFTPHGN